MSRDGSGTYTLPAGSTVTNGETSDASDINTPLTDIETDLNTDRPIVAGGTGASTAKGARSNLLFAKGNDVASASALSLGADGNYFDVTGTTAITSISTWNVGDIAVLQFDGALTLTHHATNLILPGAANITTAAGDHAIMVEYGSGTWRCIAYQKADGSWPFGGAGAFSTLSASGTFTFGGIVFTAPTGADTKLVSGTAGTTNNFAMWDANGDAIDSGIAKSTDMSADTGSTSKVPVVDAIETFFDWTYESAVTTTTGTSISVTTSIPADAREVELLVKGVSLNGTDDLLVQIGDSGGVETTGYTGTGSDSSGSVSVAASTGAPIRTRNASRVLYGTVTFRRYDASNTWLIEHSLAAIGGTNATLFGQTIKQLTATFDRIQIASSGTDDFDAGEVTVRYR